MTSIRCTDTGAPIEGAATPPSALGVTVDVPRSIRTDCVAFDGSGEVEAVDLSRGVEIAARSGNGLDAMELRASFFELAIGGGRPHSISLPGVEGNLSTTIGETEVTVTGRVSLAALRAAGVFATTDDDGVRQYQVELGPLAIELRREDDLPLLERAAEATSAVRQSVREAADAFMDALRRNESAFSRTWDGIMGRGPRTETRFSASAGSAGEPGEVAREAIFASRFAAATRPGQPVPAGAARIEIGHLLEGGSGLGADLFRARLEGREVLVLAFRGTDAPDEWMTNLSHVVRVPDQYAQAVRLVGQVRAMHPNADLLLTGPSLGGGLAAFSGLMTGVRSYAFNAAGVQIPTALQLPADADFSLVTHVRTQADPLGGVLGGVAGRPWGDTSCVIREPASDAREFSRGLLRSVHDRTLNVAQWIEHHRIGSVVSKLSVPGAVLDCVRVR